MARMEAYDHVDANTVGMVAEGKRDSTVVVGGAANLVTIWIISRRKCGLSKCVTVYMLAMATTDLLVLINNVVLYYILSYHFPWSFLFHTALCRVIMYLTAVTTDLSVWCVICFTFDRFVLICCRKIQTKYCTRRTSIKLVITIAVVIVLKEIPVLFAYEPEQIINKVQWGCRSSEAFFSSSAGTGYVWFYSACVFWVPFSLIVLCNALIIKRIVLANRARNGLRSCKIGNESDSEMENRRKSIILLFSITVSFLLLCLPYAVALGVTKLASTIYVRGKFTDPELIAMESADILWYFSCLLNPCIYAATQSKFRAELKNMAKCQWVLFWKSAGQMSAK
ncbi:C-C chemokine receptor type 6-like [Stegostoma tigrinum]|uniref:C-C chemokine receptor type 6-like n=1 Tax=Stegostoma tigrinum TaxID=3053191 RepID=UPI00202AFEEE|nr:C-C chemokine receptor type 6-like [Stegostoma tigrinum]